MLALAELIARGTALNIVKLKAMREDDEEDSWLKREWDQNKEALIKEYKFRGFKIRPPQIVESNEEEWDLIELYKMQTARRSR